MDGRLKAWAVAPALAVLLAASASADERIRPASVLLREGYRPVAAAAAAGAAALPPEHALVWPVRFQDAEHTIGNSMAQYQPFGGAPYYHGGCDLRVHAGDDVRAPVGGRLEAGAYSYSVRPDGSLEKFWKPWPEEGDPTYFEIAVVSEDGIRYEFHHVDRETLPKTIVAKLDAGGGRVDQGELLGRAVAFPMDGYDHIHYNIILPDGTRVNPEYASPLLPDHAVPVVLHAFAVLVTGEVRSFGDGRFDAPVREFVIHALDKQDANVYEHPPAFSLLRFDAGPRTSWDFRTVLSGAEGKFPPLGDFFLESIHSPEGDFSTEGGYGTGASLIRLKVPDGARGAFTIELGDVAGNTTVLRGSLAGALSSPRPSSTAAR